MSPGVGKEFWEKEFFFSFFKEKHEILFRFITCPL